MREARTVCPAGSRRILERMRAGAGDATSHGQKRVPEAASVFFSNLSSSAIPYTDFTVFYIASHVFGCSRRMGRCMRICPYPESAIIYVPSLFGHSGRRPVTLWGRHSNPFPLCTPPRGRNFDGKSGRFPLLANAGSVEHWSMYCLRILSSERSPDAVSHGRIRVPGSWYDCIIPARPLHGPFSPPEPMSSTPASKSSPKGVLRAAARRNRRFGNRYVFFSSSP